MGMMLRRKLKTLSENVTTKQSLGMDSLPFTGETMWKNEESNKDEEEKEQEYSDSDIQFDSEPVRRGRPRKSD